MNASCNRALTLPRLTLAFLIILAVYLFRDSWIPADSPYGIHAPAPQPDVQQQSDTTAEKTSDSAKKPQDDDCRSMPGADNVLILLKTGATEIYEKLPTHFMTLFKCAPHYMIFSDLAQDYADFPIRDAIAPVSKQFREQHEDFTLYRKLQQYQREGQDTSKLKGGEGWNLDKWKFLPLLFEAFESAPPNIDWFFMMEADTSVSWTNLLQWLNTMDASDPIYAGSQNVIGGTEFAHGGSGVLLSRQAAKQLQETRNQEGKEKYNKRWEETTSSSCCGDEVLARALLEADVPMKPAWPLIQGETVATVDFTKNHWCTPAITWHHVTPLEIDALWQFQADWTEDHGWDTPYLFRDIFDHFIDSHITFNRHAWNNLSQDRKLVAASIASDDDIDISRLSQLEQKAVESESACEAACQRDLHRRCVQWMFSPGRCYLGEVVRFGKTDEREGESWISGWNSERVAKHKAQLGTCKKVDWKDGES